jgi:hypothetical protein
MTTKIYTNSNNGGREKVINDNGRFYVQSDWGKGFTGEPIEVSRSKMEACLEHTNAPAAVRQAILG